MRTDDGRPAVVADDVTDLTVLRLDVHGTSGEGVYTPAATTNKND